MEVIIAAIIAAVVGTTTAVVSGVKQNQAIDEANAEGRMLAEKQTVEQQKLTDANDRMNNYQLGLQKQELSWNKRQAAKDRAEKGAERGHDYRGEFFNKNLSMVNQDATLRNNFISNMRRAA